MPEHRATADLERPAAYIRHWVRPIVGPRRVATSGCPRQVQPLMPVLRPVDLGGYLDG